jgi:phage baseplate assembly protein W
MSRFERRLAGFRRVATRRGDTLQALALRELGDAGRWHEIAWLNGLLPPYLTDDPALATPRVLLTGAELRLPSGARGPSGVADPSELYGTDVYLAKGLLEAESGDLSTVTGTTNLVQALEHRLRTQPGDLAFHPLYGCDVYRLLGGRSTARTALLGRHLVARALRADPRVADVPRARVEVQGDALHIEVQAMAVGGKEVSVGVPA